MSPTEERFYEIAKKLESKGVTMSQMFGMPSFKLNDKVFAGLFDSDMIFKLEGFDHKEALDLDGAKLFNPMGGSPMKEWVQVPGEFFDKWESFTQKALENVQS